MADLNLTPHYEMFVPISSVTRLSGPFTFSIPFNYAGMTVNSSISNPACQIIAQLRADGEEVADPITNDPTFATGPTISFNSDGLSGTIRGSIQTDPPAKKTKAFLFKLTLPLSMTITGTTSSFQIQHSRTIMNPSRRTDDVIINAKSKHKSRGLTASISGTPLNFPETQDATATIETPVATFKKATSKTKLNHFDVTVDVPIDVNPSTTPNNGNPTYLAVVFVLNMLFGTSSQRKKKPPATAKLKKLTP